MNTQKFKELDYKHFELAKLEVKRRGQLEVGLSGMSMYPLYKNIEGQKITVHHLEDIKDLKRFDIVTFWQGNILITHYFWQKNRNFVDDPNDPMLVTRPLNPLKGFDTPIKFSQILGVVRERKISSWHKFRIYLNFLLGEK